MSIEELLQQGLNALMTGSIYALLALGLGMVFSILGLINFAQGEIVVLGGYAMWFTSSLGTPFWVSLLSALVVSALASYLLERIAFRPLRGASPVTLLLTSFALSFLIQSVLSFTASSRAAAIVVPSWATQQVQLGFLQAPVLSLAALVITAVALVALTQFLRRSRTGIAIRAAADDMGALGLTGIKVNTVVSATFIISGLLAGFAAIVLFTRAGSVGPTSGVLPGVIAFVAIVIGGVGSLSGAVIGGFFLGIVQVGLQVLLPTDFLPFRDAILFSLVIVILILRPTGLVTIGRRLGVASSKGAVS